jgi:hypothetical protein
MLRETVVLDLERKVILNITYDSGLAAPAAFKTAMSYVVSYLEAEFTNSVTVNIEVGWGEVGGQPLDSGALGESITNSGPGYTYSQILTALSANTAKSATDQTALANLNFVDPTHGSFFNISNADAKALGLAPANGSAVDGYVGFDSTPGTFNFDAVNRASPGLYDFVGVALHEITEVMGRIAGLGFGDYSALDLFRYSSTGVHQLSAARSAYFSVDGGITHLGSFNANSGGDYGDWASSAGNDAFLAFSSPGVTNAFSAVDAAVMDAIGWNTAPANSSGSLVSSAAIQADYQTVLRVPLASSDAADVAAGINMGQFSLQDYLSQLSSQARNTTAAVESIFQMMAGKTLDSASLDSEVQTITHLTTQYNSAVGWNGIGASLADSKFAPDFNAKYEPLNGDAFITAVTTAVFGTSILNAGVRNALDLYINFYASAPDNSDPTGVIRGKGYFVADMLHQASDIHAGNYQAAAQTFLVGLVNGTNHYGDPLFG